jgi:hypothetical protein
MFWTELDGSGAKDDGVWWCGVASSLPQTPDKVLEPDTVANTLLWTALSCEVDVVDCTEVKPNTMLLTELNCGGDVVDCTEVVPNTMLWTARAGLD